MQVNDGGHTYNVVIVGGASANTGNNLIDDPRYPNEAKDFVTAFKVLRGLPCDIFLGAHGAYFTLKEKYPLLKPSGPNPFLDHAGYVAYIDDREKVFQTELAAHRRRPGTSKCGGLNPQILSSPKIA